MLLTEDDNNVYINANEPRVEKGCSKKCCFSFTVGTLKTVVLCAAGGFSTITAVYCGFLFITKLIPFGKIVIHIALPTPP